MDGIDGTGTWYGWGEVAHNSIKIGGLLDAKDRLRRRRHSAALRHTGRSEGHHGPERPPSSPFSV